MCDCITADISSEDLYNMKCHAEYYPYSNMHTSTVSLISESDFLLKVTCNGLLADTTALYLALESARLLRLDKEATEALVESTSSLDKLRWIYIQQ